MHSPSVLIPLACAVALAIRLARAAFTRYSRYKALRGLRGPPSASLLSGNLAQLADAAGLKYLDQFLAEYGPVARVHGICGDTALFLTDPLALSHILVKDADNFPEVDFTGSTHLLTFMFGPGLVPTNGPRHRRQRKMLNPLFSTGHMRRATPLVRSITQQYMDRLVSQVRLSSGDVDIAPGFAGLALEVITQFGFQHTFHALDGKANDYIRAAKEILPAIASLSSFMIPFVGSGLSSLPPKLLRMGANTLAPLVPPLRTLLTCVDVMHFSALDIWEAKKTLLASGDALLTESVREETDLLSVLLKEHAQGDLKGRKRVPDDELLSHVNTLIDAGAESTSTVICRALHQLALHPDVQDRLRAEILQAGRDLDYDTLNALPLLDAVCKETNRQQAFFPYRSRQATKETVIPLAKGDALHIPAGTMVLMNCHGLNTDPALWGADAHAWRPDRWLEPIPTAVIDAKIPGIYTHSMSFLSGPKACIGYTLAILEMKTALAVMLPIMSFAPPEQHEIIWRSGVTVSPSVKGVHSFLPTMPLQVKLLNTEAR